MFASIVGGTSVRCALAFVAIAAAAAAAQTEPPAASAPLASKADDAGSKSKSSAKVDGKWVLADWPAIRFAEVTKAAGIDCLNRCGEPDKPRLIDTLGSGMCWFDYDGDGWLDLFIPNGSTLDAVLGKTQKVTKPDGSVVEEPIKNEFSDKLFRNRGDGTFEDVTERAGLRDDRWGISATAADFDNDGDSDLFVCNFGPCFLYRNDGDGTFTDIAKDAGVEFGTVTPGSGWGDVDGDGDLDLYVAAYITWDPENPWRPFDKVMRGMRVMLGPKGLEGETDKLFRNDGGGKFTEITKEAGLRIAEKEHGFTTYFIDLNQDDLLDIFVANDMTPNHYYRQVKPGRFTPSGDASGLSVDGQGQMKACMGVALGDLNDDLIPDFYITNFAAETNDLFVSQGDNYWKEDPRPTERACKSEPYVGWGTGFWDLDLDGDEDLVAFNGHVFPQLDQEKNRTGSYKQLPLLYRRDGPVKFSDARTTAGDGFYKERAARGAGFADYDDDGDVDVALFEMDLPAVLLRNDTPREAGTQRSHFLRAQLLGTTINRDAYGSRIVIEAGGRRHTRWILGQGSFISQNDPRALVGLGLTDEVDRITVRWTGGQEEVIEGPIAVDRTIVIKQGMGKVTELTGEGGKPQLMTRAEADALHAKALGSK